MNFADIVKPNYNSKKNPGLGPKLRSKNPGLGIPDPKSHQEVLEASNFSREVSNAGNCVEKGPFDGNEKGGNFEEEDENEAEYELEDESEAERYLEDEFEEDENIQGPEMQPSTKRNRHKWVVISESEDSEIEDNVMEEEEEHEFGFLRGEDAEDAEYSPDENADTAFEHLTAEDGIGGDTDTVEEKGSRYIHNELVVGCLEDTATEFDIREALRKVVSIVSVKLMTGYAFVRFASAEEADRVLTELKHLEVNGKQCRVYPVQVDRKDTLFLSNICRTWTNQKLVDELRRFGVKNIANLTLKASTLNCNYAFAKFRSHTDAMSAYKRLQERDVFLGLDRTARVSFAFRSRDIHVRHSLEAGRGIRDDYTARREKIYDVESDNYGRKSSVLKRDNHSSIRRGEALAPAPLERSSYVTDSTDYFQHKEHMKQHYNSRKRYAPTSPDSEYRVRNTRKRHAFRDSDYPVSPYTRRNEYTGEEARSPRFLGRGSSRYKSQFYSHLSKEIIPTRGYRYSDRNLPYYARDDQYTERQKRFEPVADLRVSESSRHSRKPYFHRVSAQETSYAEYSAADIHPRSPHYSSRHSRHRSGSGWRMERDESSHY